MSLQSVGARLSWFLSPPPILARKPCALDKAAVEPRPKRARSDDPERALDFERLAALAREFFDAKAIEDLERLVGAAMGARMRHLSMELVEPPRRILRGYIGARRTHSRHNLAVHGQVAPEWRHTVRDGVVNVFVKTGGSDEIAPIEHALNDMRPRFFRAPRVLGAYRGRHGAATVWEHVKGRNKSLANIGFAAQIQLVHAIAEFNAAPHAHLGLSSAAPPPPTSWFGERLALLPLEQQPEWARELETIEALDRALPLRERLPEQSARFISHNDLNTNNVMIGDELVIIDWEGARLAPPGADLGFLYTVDREDALFDVYVGAMAGLGHSLDRTEVWRNAGAARVHRLLYGGWSRRNLRQVRVGIAALERLGSVR